MSKHKEPQDHAISAFIAHISHNHDELVHCTWKVKEPYAMGTKAKL